MLPTADWYSIEVLFHNVLLQFYHSTVEIELINISSFKQVQVNTDISNYKLSFFDDLY